MNCQLDSVHSWEAGEPVQEADRTELSSTTSWTNGPTCVMFVSVTTSVSILRLLTPHLLVRLFFFFCRGVTHLLKSVTLVKQLIDSPIIKKMISNEKEKIAFFCVYFKQSVHKGKQSLSL